MKTFFQLAERGTDVKTEVLAGMTTFLTMAYIVVVNPAILSAAGVPFNQVFIATIISAVVGTLIMALWANYPIAIAPGMGMNAYFVTVVLNQGVSYQAVFATVFFAGIIFIILTFTSLREALIAAIPNTLKVGITSGIGLFIAFLGLRMSGIIVQNSETFVSFGDITNKVTLLSIFGLVITLILVARGVKGGLFYGMLFTGIIGYLTHMMKLDGIVSLPPTPVFFDLDLGGVFTESLYTVVFAFLLVTIFDTTGTLIGVAEQAGLMKNGKLEKAKAALTADAVATTVGATFGTTPSSAYIESTSGVQVGGRTGLTTLVVSLLFILALFFSPIIETISALPAITAPALIIVGSYMMSGLETVRWKQFDEAFPAFIVILTMPLTSSIATGIALGFITYPLIKLFSGKGKEVHPLVYVFGVIFVLQMIYFPGH
ncbi:NCS2 family permease [Phocicoccus pinnipedialis]|uniref:Guanine/hypoxanthine permease PbuG n=1 Tax=Phocicoccus pinnipedialis TaxID=110845 RepID=A0A6V7RCF3_9BACL|nr:NCS2 family permease [Jeotgalicoccus pinnipedialis]MBP1939879.1 AGZA family xanthine/uracil permease-like MFS transporter [Jeotgalicoccus pinnipedialis]CAD2074683.1 Guanine/hypoxanthine permease PbuG [Jeotgalicoccus pinnipedialis]